ncbi:hypothetical protein GC098_07700 [Paenibacillus sp. LMG 31458]|uniref:Uncharacterized protein n=1 Tax=Paenibacillus phytorum TaxID=2654977 RepID=A0ABX1XSN0_9BACL|nr:hypothetical protein [Paenibacillus phytorum]
MAVSLRPKMIVRSEEAALDPDEVDRKVESYMSDDRVFGYMAPFHIDEFYQPDKVDKLRSEIAEVNDGIIVVIGFGASLIASGDVLIYADLARWEIQLRYRAKVMDNWRASKREDDTLRLYKRSFFFEWRMADRLKRSLFDRVNYYLDSNTKNEPKMLSKQALFAGLSQTASQPFRLVPCFDPGVWGGTWLESNIDLPKKIIHTRGGSMVCRKKTAFIFNTDLCVWRYRHQSSLLRID